MRKKISAKCPIERTPRVMQLEGIFDISPARYSELNWDVDLPLEKRDWSIGLITGPSGCGKTTIARALFPNRMIASFRWPARQSIIDGFPKPLPIKDITQLLCSVGFSSPPAWLRPYRVLSVGEQFRLTLARAMAEKGKSLFVIDEFTSVVDRTVAKIGSHAIAKTIRARGAQFVAVSCHHDIVDWLQPDWIYEPSEARFQWRSVRRRPGIKLEIYRVGREAWDLFAPHHYLSNSLARNARCFCAFLDQRPVAFMAMISFPHAISPGWRHHRLVVLPDFQGVGIAHALNEYVAGVYRAKGRPVRMVASHPGVLSHCLRSPKWKLIRKASHTIFQKGTLLTDGLTSTQRLTMSFEFRGAPNPEDLLGFRL